MLGQRLNKLLLIKKRPDFVHVSKNGVHVVKSGFILQVAENKDKRVFAYGRIGYTASKKVGCAVERARAKRRVRPLIAKNKDLLKPGYDYVVICRSYILNCEYKKLEKDISLALNEVNSKLLSETTQLSDV